MGSAAPTTTEIATIEKSERPIAIAALSAYLQRHAARDAWLR
jgi:hypothetical protein